MKLTLLYAGDVTLLQKKDINQAWICWAFMEKTKTFEDEKKIG